MFRPEAPNGRCRTDPSWRGTSRSTPLSMGMRGGRRSTYPYTTVTTAPPRDIWWRPSMPPSGEWHPPPPPPDPSVPQGEDSSPWWVWTPTPNRPDVTRLWITISIFLRRSNRPTDRTPTDRPPSDAVSKCRPWESSSDRNTSAVISIESARGILPRFRRGRGNTDPLSREGSGIWTSRATNGRIRVRSGRARGGWMRTCAGYRSTYTFTVCPCAKSEGRRVRRPPWRPSTTSPTARRPIITAASEGEEGDRRPIPPQLPAPLAGSAPRPYTPPSVTGEDSVDTNRPASNCPPN
mmetsp:Transcript_22001/g.65119  ORF Transcript_22001/g.65119 Transcript_22001/m.65119 type:complete len:293 (+) Transcript_22001:2374-3252(+)